VDPAGSVDIAHVVVIPDVEDDVFRGEVPDGLRAHGPQVGLVDPVAADTKVPDRLAEMRGEDFLPGFAVADLGALRVAVAIDVNPARRAGMAEHLAEDGKSFVPVFIPFWKGDRPLCEKPIQQGSRPVIVIRIGHPVDIKCSPGKNTPTGRYRVVSTMQSQIQLLPDFLADNKEALTAAGYLANGVNIGWNSFIKAAGYELPHRPSDQAKPAGAAPA
jgi:hypothetical protein